MKRKILVLVLISLAPVIGLTQDGNMGGICAALTVTQKLKSADVVLLGEVVKRITVDDQPYLVQGPTNGRKERVQRVALTLRVEQSWLTDESDLVTIYDWEGCAYCVGLDTYKVGEKYLIYGKLFLAEAWLKNGGSRQKLAGASLPKPGDKILTPIGCKEVLTAAAAKEEIQQLHNLATAKRL